MRIGIYAPYYWPFEGGAERVARRVASELSKNHDICVFTLKFRSDLPSWDNDGPVRICRLPYTHRRPLGLTTTNSPALLHRLRDSDLDLLQIHGVTFADMTLRVCRTVRKCGIPVLLVSHGIFEAYEGTPDHPPLARIVGIVSSRILLGMLLWSSSHVALLSPSERELLSKYALPAERASLVYNGFEPPRPASASADRFRALHSLENKQIVLHVATLKPNKGHQTMIEALPRLAKQFPNVRYVVVGQAGGLWQSYWEALQEQVRRTEVQDRILFLGHISDDELRDAYAAADIAVLPSYAETFPLAVLDAMAWGKPVVATRVGGIEHMLTDGRTGLLIEPRDSDALAVAIRRLLTDTDLSARIGAHARTFVHDRFSWTKVIGRYDEICQQLVKQV